MKSLMGRPKTIIAGDNLVSGSGVFLYLRITHCTTSTSRAPPGPVLFVRILFMSLDTCFGSAVAVWKSNRG